MEGKGFMSVIFINLNQDKFLRELRLLAEIAFTLHIILPR